MNIFYFESNFKFFFFGGVGGEEGGKSNRIFFHIESKSNIFFLCEGVGVGVGG